MARSFFSLAASRGCGQLNPSRAGRKPIRPLTGFTITGEPAARSGIFLLLYTDSYVLTTRRLCGLRLPWCLPFTSPSLSGGPGQGLLLHRGNASHWGFRVSSCLRARGTRGLILKACGFGVGSALSSLATEISWTRSVPPLRFVPSLCDCRAGSIKGDKTRPRCAMRFLGGGATVRSPLGWGGSHCCFKERAGLRLHRSKCPRRGRCSKPAPAGGVRECCGAGLLCCR